MDDWDLYDHMSLQCRETIGSYGLIPMPQMDIEKVTLSSKGPNNPTNPIRLFSNSIFKLPFSVFIFSYSFVGSGQ